MYGGMRYREGAQEAPGAKFKEKVPVGKKGGSILAISRRVK
jgi:hypothetical protein